MDEFFTEITGVSQKQRKKTIQEYLEPIIKKIRDAKERDELFINLYCFTTPFFVIYELSNAGFNIRLETPKDDLPYFCVMLVSE